MARELLWRSYEVKAELRAELQERAVIDADYLFERFGDMDVPITNESVATAGTQVMVTFSLGVDPMIKSLQKWAESILEESGCDELDLEVVSVTVGTEPLPYTADELEENARHEASWAHVDAVWPTLVLGDYVDVFWHKKPLYGPGPGPGNYVVESVEGDEIVMRRHALLDPIVPVGDEVRLQRLEIERMVRQEVLCGHDHDRRLPTPCADCQFAIRCMIGGLHSRVVL